MGEPFVHGDLGGLWFNELGSQMRLEPHDDGQLRGSYLLAAGVSPDAPAEPRPLVGFFDPEPGPGSAAISFTVAWLSTHSITAWIGRHDGDRDVITTTWLYTVDMGLSSSGWRPTMVGSDLFSRIPPSK
jgi:hypothetical protein